MSQLGANGDLHDDGVVYAPAIDSRLRIVSIVSAVGFVERDPWAALEPGVIFAACVAAGHAWRERVPEPVVTLQLFVLQVLHGNASCRALTRLAVGAGVEAAFTAEAYCQARAWLPLAVLRWLVAATTLHALRGRQGGGEGGWRGHRVLLMDGSGAKREAMPDVPGLAATLRPRGRPRKANVDEKGS